MCRINELKVAEQEAAAAIASGTLRVKPASSAQAAVLAPLASLESCSIATPLLYCGSAATNWGVCLRGIDASAWMVARTYVDRVLRVQQSCMLTVAQPAHQAQAFVCLPAGFAKLKHVHMY